jgi:lipocalin
LSCITAEYGFIDDTTVTVKNAGIRFSNNNQTAITEGKAVVPNPSQPNKLQVKFPLKLFGFPIWENSGDYQVWSTDYSRYSLVYSCTQLIPGFLRAESAWILGRQKTLSDTILNELKGLLGQARIDSGKFIKADQSC